MSSQKRLFGTNGIRGLANKELTPTMAIRIGGAIGTFFNRGELLVGHDARTSSPMFAKAVVSGMTATGCNILFAGMAPTPALQYAVKKHRTAGGVIITASHNPPEYNGIKVIWRDGVEISHEQELRIEKIHFKEETRYTDWNNLGTTQHLPGVIDEYVEAIKTHVSMPKIARGRYNVVVDAANSVGGLAAPLLLRDLGCTVTTINADIDGTFPGRPPEPRPENLAKTALTVKAVEADLGVAFDGDADRSVFIDEQGEIRAGDETFALVEKHFLEENEGEKIITPISSSTLVEDIARAHGGELVWTKVGSVTVSQTMKKLGAKLGGEENGGIFYGPHQPVRDGAMATALILDIMAKTKQKLSKLLAELPKYFIEKSQVECPEELKGKVLQSLIQQLKNVKTSTIDGVKIWFNDKSAILIRPSGTEPIYRLYAEAKTQRKASKLINEYSSKLKRAIDDLTSVRI
jgi:phosphomannomutase/phosphoglucomutase